MANSKDTAKKEPSSIGKLLVNLLPSEILLQRRQSMKLALVNKISIITLVILILLASGTLALRVSQNFNFKNAQQDLVAAEGKVAALKDKEAEMVALKQRLGSIKSLQGGDTKITSIFNMVIYLTPLGIQVTEASVDKSGNMIVTMVAPEIAMVESLIENLGDKEKSSNLISKVELQGMSLGRDFSIRLVFKITPKN